MVLTGLQLKLIPPRGLVVVGGGGVVVELDHIQMVLP